MMTFPPMKMRLTVLALTGACLPALAASPLAGHWVGVFDAAGKPMFSQSSFVETDNTLSGTLNLPSEDKRGLALSKVSEQQGRVRFELAGPDGTIAFDGRVQRDTLSGTARLNGKDTAFAFQRSLAPSPESDARVLGAYRFPGQRLVVLSHLGDFPQLFYTDMKTGRYAAMYQSEANAYFAGAGFLNPTVRETSMRFETDAAGKVRKMVWQEAGKRSQVGERIDFRTRELTFKNGDVTLSGTLVMPAGPGPFPAVVLTQMSSPSPRSAYALQANYFAAHGIAALMYDKRGVGASTGDWQKASMQDLADDAVAGITTLAAQPEINAAKIGTWGHSQGGWLAPLAAVRSGKVAFVIAQSASGVPPAEQEIYRIETSLRSDGFSEAEVRDAVAYERALMHWVTSGGEGRADLLALARAGEKARWADKLEIVPDTMRARPREETTAFYRYDPLPDLDKLTSPVLYILGDKDTFVPVAKSAALFEQTLAAAGHRDYQVWMLKNATHGLWESPQDGANAFVNSRHWARTHYPRMTQWLLKRGLATPLK